MHGGFRKESEPPSRDSCRCFFKPGDSIGRHAVNLDRPLGKLEADRDPRTDDRRRVGDLRALADYALLAWWASTRRTIGTGWMASSGSAEPERRGATCRPRSANGTPCGSNSVAGSESGVWDLLLQALADSGGTLDMLQMMDSTIIRRIAAPPAKRPRRTIRRSVVRAVGSAPRSICVATP